MIKHLLVLQLRLVTLQILFLGGEVALGLHRATRDMIVGGNCHTLAMNGTIALGNRYVVILRF